MNANETKISKTLLSIFMIPLLFIIENEISKLIISMIYLLISIIFSYIYSAKLFNNNQKKDFDNILKYTRFFDITLFLGCFIFTIVLLVNDIYTPQYNNKYLYATIISMFILFNGNISSILPINLSLGLKLPWTLEDKESWNVCSNVLGFLSIPLSSLYMQSINVIDNFILLSLIIISLWIGVPSILSYIFYKKQI